MKTIETGWHWLITLLVLAIGVTGTASAHLMVAQRGTLNFTDKGVYMVLSLPASAFTYADDNSDARLQQSEFIEHRLAIINSIKNNVVLHNEKMSYVIEGMMLTPVVQDQADHKHENGALKKASSDADSNSIEQIIVMGRFAVNYSDKTKLYFKAALSGKNDAEKLLTIAAKLADKSKTHEFEIRPDSQSTLLFSKSN